MCTPPEPLQSPRLQDPKSVSSPAASQSSASTTSPPLRRLLDETSDLIDSPTFTDVLTLLLDATFSHLVDRKLRSEAYKLPPLTSTPIPEPRITEVNDPNPLTASAKLATILALMTREAHKIGNGVPNEYIQAIEAVSELEGFAAVVYSSNFDLESGFETNSTLYPACLRSKGDAAGGGQDGQGEEGEEGLDDASNAAEEEEEQQGDVYGMEKGGGIMKIATGVVDAAWGGFDSVWGKVTGSGE